MAVRDPFAVSSCFAQPPNAHDFQMDDPPIRIVTSLPLDNPLQDAFYAVVSRANDPFNSTCYLSAIFSSRLEAVNHLRQLISTTAPIGYQNGAHFLAFNHFAHVIAPDGADWGEGYVFETGNGVVRTYSIQSVAWEFVLPREVREWAFGSRSVDQPTQYAESNLQPTAATALVNQQIEEDWASRIGMEGTWVSRSQQNTASNMQPTGFLPASTAPFDQQFQQAAAYNVESKSSATPVSTPSKTNVVRSQTTASRSVAFEMFVPNGPTPDVPSSKRRKPRPKKKE
ncbi:hypothetical protein PRZ48_011919 [Zasmidium cellare]|uniref:Uncharacterized protein n=1 Tax=Zasmidium cellare TaxID=395010 RepID=A0ABR0E881_ZASCE|nr:hypothetical protein PRZ48_011919 [Zasmidium cellare]